MIATRSHSRARSEEDVSFVERWVEATVCFILDPRRQRVLLKFANRGISKGKWNGLGGKIEPGESPLDCVVREVFEESGLSIGRLFRHGKLEFCLSGGRDILVHVYSTSRYSGTLRSSSEGRLAWHPIERLPFVRMWDDDRFWLRFVLLGERIRGRFYYDPTDSFVVRYDFKAHAPTRVHRLSPSPSMRGR